MKEYRKDTGTRSALPSGRPTDFGKAGAREMNRHPRLILNSFGRVSEASKEYRRVPQ
jgi:hypothetical protein